MAQPPPPQIPQHVSALLSHLTSRPGVQSTLILSRKDGSIIQSTGLLAPSSSPTSSGAASAPPRTNSISITENPSTTTTSGAAAATSPDNAVASPSSHQDTSTTLNTASSKNQNLPYKPTQAEALAAHIHAFMASASGLTLSLSGSTSGPETGHESRPKVNGTEDSTSGTGEDLDRENEREDDDEIKLLRLRTKKHEIVVVPDRKYLLCVVHDASGATSGSAGASGISR